MKIDSLGEIIAERKLNIVGDEHRKLIVKIGKPQTFPDSLDYYCPYQIIGLGKEKIRYAGGIDAVQALILALKMIGADLYTSKESVEGKLRWEGDEKGNLGFPYPDTTRDLVLNL